MKENNEDVSGDILSLLNKNDIKFVDIKIYEQAFIHRSYINENPKLKMGHNERLEFLGDSVLELIVTNFLYNKYPNHSEGDLTSYRAALVNASSIGEVAERLDFNPYLKLSKGESKDAKSKARMSILADTYESMLGAIYLDLGYDACVKFVSDTLLPNTDGIVSSGLFKDAKSQVQEMSQEKYQVTPVYRVIEESGPDHNKTFVVGIYFDHKQIAKGEGSSKQLAEGDAAKNAIQKEGWY